MVLFFALLFTVRLLLLLWVFPLWDWVGSFRLDRVKTAELLADFGSVSAFIISLFPRDFTRIFGNVLIIIIIIFYFRRFTINPTT